MKNFRFNNYLEQYQEPQEVYGFIGQSIIICCDKISSIAVKSVSNGFLLYPSLNKEQRWQDGMEEYNRKY